MYNFEDVLIKVDGADIFCANASISFETSYEVDRGVEGRITYKPSGPGIGNLSLSYYVTGSDFLYNLIEDSLETPISGSFAGLYFNSGYLTNHSLSVVNNNLATANCSISFYDEIKGSIETGRANYNHVPLGHSSRSYIDSYYGAGNNFQFSLSNNIRYSVDFNGHSHIPRNVRKTNIDTSLLIEGDDIGNYLYWSGQSGLSQLHICDIHGSSLQSYGITGRIISKNIDINGEYIIGSVNITQVR